VERYNFGTGARKLEENYVPEPRKAQKKARKLDKPFLTLFITAVVLAFALLGRYSEITEKTSRIEHLKKEYETVSSQVVAKSFELERSIDLEKIEEVATTKLNMQRPEKHQLVYVNMNNSDYCEVSEEHKTGFLATMRAGFMSAVEYFK